MRTNRHGKCPEKLEDTETFQDVPDIATKLWEHGYRPKWAKDVETGEMIAYLPSMFGFPMTDEYSSARVVGVVDDGMGSILIQHNGPENDDSCDELTEVWTRQPMDLEGGEW